MGGGGGGTLPTINKKKRMIHRQTEREEVENCENSEFQYDGVQLKRGERDVTRAYICMSLGEC